MTPLAQKRSSPTLETEIGGFSLGDRLQSSCQEIAQRQSLTSLDRARLELVAYDNFYKVLNVKNAIVLSSLYLGYDPLSYLEADC